jgi:hypothetical protein
MLCIHNHLTTAYTAALWEVVRCKATYCTTGACVGHLIKFHHYCNSIHVAWLQHGYSITTNFLHYFKNTYNA